MKKFTMIAVVLCVAFMFAVPAMAVEVTTDGYYRVRGFSGNGYALHKDKDRSDDYFDMRLRVNADFVVSDVLKITTRFNALSRTMGTKSTASASISTFVSPVTGTTYNSTMAPGSSGLAVDTDDDFAWLRTYMSVTTPMGLFRAGRMAGGLWGTSFNDTETEEDRIRFDTGFGSFKTGVIYHHLKEGDKGLDITSGDIERYTAYGLFKQETFQVGLLCSVIKNHFLSDGDNFSDYKIALTKALGAYKATQYVATPFFTAKFGKIGLQGELASVTGDDKDYYQAALKDTDKDTLNYNLEGSFDFGAGSAFLGYAFASGEDKKDDATGTSLGDDWEKLFILTGSTGGVAGKKKLGGVGNWSAGGGNNDGIKLIYGGASFKPADNITLGLKAGTAKADEANEPAQKDDIGVEVDLTLAWTFFDGGLKYSAIAAYLDAGDYFKVPVTAAKFEDSCYTLFHYIQLYF